MRRIALALAASVFVALFSPAVGRAENTNKKDVLANGALVEIRSYGLPETETIGGLFKIGRSGTIVLGPSFGAVRIQGLTTDEAVKAIDKHLQQFARNFRVSLEDVSGSEMLQKQAVLRAVRSSCASTELGLNEAKPHTQLAAGDLLEIRAAPNSTLPDQPIAGLYRINADGVLVLGPS